MTSRIDAFTDPLAEHNPGEKIVSFMDAHRDEPVEWSHERAGFDLGETAGMDSL